MRKRTVFFQYFSIHFLLVFVSITISTLFSTTALVSLLEERTRKEQKAICSLIVNMLPEKGFLTIFQAQVFAINASAGTSKRVTFIKYSGKVLADSHSDPASMENNFYKPEVREALQGTIGTSTRYSRIMQEEMFFTAIPVPSKNLIVRTAVSVEDVNRNLEALSVKLGISVLAILFVASVIAYFIAKQNSGLINSVKNVARHYASGDFSVSLKEDGSSEMQELSESINIMGKQLKDKINTILSQYNELQSMLNSMKEPVILMDENMDVLEVNPSAVDIVYVREILKSRNLENIVKFPNLVDIVKKCIATKKYQNEVICFDEKEENYYVVNVSFIEKLGEERNRVLLVLNDVSDVKRLEKMRKEFAANVSHELKTPVTSIIGYVETLQATGKNLSEKDMDKFLNIISRQAQRLEIIIEDILTLSKVDDEGSLAGKELVPASDLLGSSAAACFFLVEQKNMTIRIECDEEIEIFVHPVLAEQAVFNLIDNAVKYSSPKSTVFIKAEVTENFAIITVVDSGCGIPKNSLEQIFDRFYRVDKSRSRDLGGTGLGLAIVKHVARIHGGKVEVESEEGKGSVFRLYFSRNQDIVVI